MRWVRITVSGIPDGKDKRLKRAVSTDAKGAFRLTGFYRGVYTVKATRRGYRTASAPDQRQGNESLRFEMRKTGSR